MNYPSLYLAWRYIKSGHTEKTIALMSTICFCGILIGTFSLALVLFVMRGFETETHAKLQGIHAQIIIRGYGDPLNDAQIATVLNNEFPAIQAISPTSMRQALIQGHEQDDGTHVVIIKGIDPQAESQVSSIGKTLTGVNAARLTLPQALEGNHIALGAQLAKILDVSVGDPVTLLFADTEHAHSRKVTFNEKRAVVGGIFTTGIDEFDSTLIFCALPFFDTIFPDAGIDQINIKLAHNVDEQPIIDALKQRLGLDVYSWKDLYPALVSALKLEKYAMLIILALIALVASMSIISLLFMQITQKRGDIAILKAMGAHDRTILSIFLIMGMSIAFIGCISGIILAVIVGLLLQYYPLITLPDAYYVSHIPVTLEWSLVLIVFTIVMVLSFIATWIPAQKARSLIVAHVLRFEA